MRQYDGENEIAPLVWERNIEHTIRQDGKDGFLFPFKEIKQFLSKHPDRNPDDFLVIIPQEYQLDFSYATDYVSTDATIWALNRAREVLKTCQNNAIGGNLQEQLNWLDTEIKKAWQNRPTYPGLGALLATRFKYGFDLAETIEEIAHSQNKDAIDIIPEIIQNHQQFMTDDDSKIFELITSSQIAGWNAFINAVETDFLKKVCKLELTYEQMSRVINLADNPSFKAELSNNPYILYEKTIEVPEEEKIYLHQIDYAVFPKDNRLALFQMEPDDQRRLRAILLHLLEDEANRGNTICPREKFLDYVQKFREDVTFIPPDKYTLDGLKDFFEEYITTKELSTRIVDDDNTEAHMVFYKTNKIQEFDDAITTSINDRINRHNDDTINWHDTFKTDEFSVESERPQIEDALNKLTYNSLSILTGGAGTAKTSVVVKFCKEPKIHEGRILFLAPTGKATQVFAQKLNQPGSVEIHTIDKFLLSCGRWSQKSGQYSLYGKTAPEYTTVIVDECSMIPETEFGALLNTLKGTKRIILVGDPNQLPPIGPGRPFFDVINYIKKRKPECLIELKYNWRQKDNRGFDVEFAKLFTNNSPQIDDIIKIADENQNVELIQYNSLDEIPTKVIETVAKIIGMKDVDDQLHFDESIGGKLSPDGKWMNFNMELVNNVEKWQLISPYKNNDSYGTRFINQMFHEKYRTNTNQNGFGYARTLCSYGEEKIVLGDKIINTTNSDVYSFDFTTRTAEKRYLPNGATGLIWSTKNNILNAVFTNAPTVSFGYKAKIGNAESGNKDDPIELAYALTTHKVQGSTYKNTIIVLYDDPNADGLNSFVSRELIYTALTRHSEKIYLVYNKAINDLLKYVDKSDLENRLTDLLAIKPDNNNDLSTITKYEGNFYNSNLKHITLDGTKVRSKSELIIANQLYYNSLEYQYESHLYLNDGKFRRPDFRVITPSGKTVYWEHLGMLNDDSYKKAWEEKKAEYEANGISEQNSNLFTTEDNEEGGLDSKQIEAVINQIKKM